MVTIRMMKTQNVNLFVSIHFILLILALPIIYLFKEIFNFDISIYYGTFYCILLMVFLRKDTKSYLSPVSIFLCFYWLMLMGRPFLSQIGLVKNVIVEASSFQVSTSFFVNIYIVITLIFIGFLFMIIKQLKITNVHHIQFPEFFLNEKGKKILIVIFLISGLLMLRDGKTAYYTLQESYYIELIKSGEIVYFNHTYYTIVKWTWFFLFILYPNKSLILILTFMIFLTALPVSGMRGYFILYLLMVFMFLEGKKIINLNLTIIVAFIFGLLSLVNFLLEYRIGFSVTDSGLMSPIYKAIFDQGSTYEAVYGAYTFQHKLSFIENVMFPSFFNFPVFGDYIDKLRGVDFNNGVGFATSALAEIISGGFIVWFVYITIFSISLSILHKAFQNLHLSNSNYFTLFFLSPIIWGQPRGSILQFFFKFVFFILFILFFHNHKIRKIKL